MLLDDRSHLSRLSTLIESNNVTEIDNFSKSPIVTESFDAFHRLALQSPALRTGRIRTPVGETFPSASPQTGKRNRTASAWFLRPTYDDDDINLDYDGTIKAGTLPALVERLTLDYLSMFAENHSPFRPGSDCPYYRIPAGGQVPAHLPCHFQVVHNSRHGF